MGRWMSGHVLFHELSAVHKIKTFGSSHMVGLFASHTTFICAVVVRESNLLPSRDVPLVFEWDR